MRQDIVDTIRKCLRIAKRAKGPEASAARARAEELMDKYGLNITDDDENHKVEFPGVANVFWKEQLLVLCGKIFSCSLLKGGHKLDVAEGRYKAVLAGYASDVNNAKVLFERVQTQLLIECLTAWKNFTQVETNDVVRDSLYDLEEEEQDDDDDEDDRDVRRSRNSLGSIFGKPVNLENEVKRAAAKVERLKKLQEEIGGGKAFELWSRTFLGSAVDVFGKQIAGRLKPPKPTPYYPPVVGVDRDELGEEIAEIIAERKRLSKNFGEKFAMRIQQEGVRIGKNCGDKIEAHRPRQKLLTNASSWLPPPPQRSRFTELDFEEALEVGETIASRRQIDVD